MKKILLEDLKIGSVYRLDSRNLSHGVYLGGGEFVGIRYKFGDEFLDNEIHFDACFKHGTVTQMEPTGGVYYDVDLYDSRDPSQYKKMFDFLKEVRNNDPES